PGAQGKEKIARETEPQPDIASGPVGQRCSVGRVGVTVAEIGSGVLDCVAAGRSEFYECRVVWSEGHARPIGVAGTSGDFHLADGAFGGIEGSRWVKLQRGLR